MCSAIVALQLQTDRLLFEQYKKSARQEREENYINEYFLLEHFFSEESKPKVERA